MAAIEQIDRVASGLPNRMVARVDAIACRGGRRWGRRRAWAIALAIGLAPVSLVVAGFPEIIDRGGRICGCGYGDGYHACYGSGLRPIANLPPRSFAARVGTIDERVHGCPTCQPHRLPGVRPVADRQPETFYDRFDRYARSVTENDARTESNRPVNPVFDPEQDSARGYSALDPLGTTRERHAYGDRTPSPFSAARPNPSSTRQSTNDESPAAPPISVKEMEEFREYQEAKRLREKFDKHLIEPDQIKPNQTFGGPPVGSDQRRKIDEDSPGSSSDRRSAPPTLAPSTIKDDNPACNNEIQYNKFVPMDELLPPFPETNRPTLDPVGPKFDPVTEPPSDRDPNLKTDIEPFARSGSGVPARARSAVRDAPAARVTQLPGSWQFVKQPGDQNSSAEKPANLR